MKKGLIFLLSLFIISILLIGCTNNVNTNQQTTKTTVTKQSTGKTGNLDKLNCDVLTHEEIMTTGGISKVLDGSSTETYTKDNYCQHAWYVQPIGHTTDDLIALYIQHYTIKGLSSSLGSVCNGKPSLGIGDLSCVDYNNHIVFQRGSYDLTFSGPLSMGQDKVIAIARLINSKL